tara:strand:+ start:571 stop:705 length:135 start_codon:yes stop_codon:yes gene_type:complete
MKIILLFILFWIIKSIYKSLTIKNIKSNENNIIDVDFEEVDESN